MATKIISSTRRSRTFLNKQHRRKRVVFLRHGEPFIRDAANLHLAMRALESEDLDGALRRFRAVEGPGPASRLAEAEIERLTAGR